MYVSLSQMLTELHVSVLQGFQGEWRAAEFHPLLFNHTISEKNSGLIPLTTINVNIITASKMFRSS